MSFFTRRSTQDRPNARLAPLFSERRWRGDFIREHHIDAVLLVLCAWLFCLLTIVYQAVLTNCVGSSLPAERGVSSWQHDVSSRR